MRADNRGGRPARALGRGRLAPAAVRHSIRHKGQYRRGWNFANPLYLAALSVPAGFTPDGLPFGLSLVGPSFSERLLVAIARRIEETIDGPLGATGLRAGAAGAWCNGTSMRAVRY
jgi:hypothetical protein